MNVKRQQLLRYLLVTVSCLTASGKTRAGQEGEPPRITTIEPQGATTTPGAKVTILGSNFAADSVVYIGGLQARETIFVNSAALEAVTPYLRPGTHKLGLKSGETVIHSEVNFRALPAPVDSTIDQAEALAAKKQTGAAITIFTSIATSHPDYDVRAYAHYRAGELYLVQGDLWNAAEQAALIWDAKASHGVHSSWQYRLLHDETAYSVSESNNHDADLRMADASIMWDVTANPELRYWRALMCARFGKMEQAKADLNFILAAQPEDLSYRALAAYIGVLRGDKTLLETFREQEVGDARALRLLGQAAYLTGDYDAARQWWTQQGKIAGAWAKLDCLAGRKHMKFGQTRVGQALIAECAAVVPESREGKEAKQLLADVR